MHGYTDEAIGYFGEGDGWEQSIGQVIRDWWGWQAETGQPRWAYLFGVGEIDADTATAWGDAVRPVL